ncbi:Protein FAM200B [Eumeta japonica]|uniref:Protein FAM200B n=1 Tax=Eumeta variegata TaxID=151549 RepID=A0A4C1ULU2_EUMVA|nr:Protein FAM200B [Eumeta japonica]
MRRLITKHQKEADKPLDFFERKSKAASSINESVLLASYKVTYRVSKAGKPHTIAENLILPAALDMGEIMTSKALQTRLFRIICEDMGSLHQNLLYDKEPATPRVRLRDPPRGRDPQIEKHWSIRYDRESVYRAYVALIREICKVHGHASSIVMYAAHMCRRVRHL